MESEEEKRIKIIQRFFNLPLPGLEEVREGVATITRMDFDEKENRWVVSKIFKDPKLISVEKKEK